MGQSGGRRPGDIARVSLAVGASTILLAALFGIALGMRLAMPSAPPIGLSTPDDLFDLTRIWNVHLQFTADQWTAMEPSDAGPGGAMGPGGPPGGRGGNGLDPLALMANRIFGEADADDDGALSREEFVTLGQRWFGQWRAGAHDTLDADAVRKGLAGFLPDEPGGPGGAGPGGPGLGGPGGPGGGRGRMEFPTVRAGLTFDKQEVPEVTARYKGNNTFMEARNSLKRSFKVDLNDLAPGRRLAGVTKLNLHNNVTDASWMNEPLSYRLFRDAGVPASRTSYARVYVTVPGTFDHRYFGLYSIVEDVGKSFVRERYGTKKGALFKPVTSQLFEDRGDEWTAYRQIYDPKTPVSDEETARVIAFSKLVSHASDDGFEANIESFLDLDEFARFMAVTVWLSNMDSILGMGQNYLVYLLPKTRQFQFIPWDLDHSFGQFPGGPRGRPEELSITKPWNGLVLLLERVFRVPRFRQLYVAYMKEFSESIFRPERLQKQVDELARVLRPAVQQESADKLARFDKVVAGEFVAPASDGGFPGGPPPGLDAAAGMPAGGGFPRGGFPGGPGQGMKPIRTFVVARAAFVLAQLASRQDLWAATPSSDAAVAAADGRGGPLPGREGGPGDGRGGPPPEGPGLFIASGFFSAIDTDKNGQITEAEFERAFAPWFDSWNTDGTGLLTEAQLRAGIERDLMPRDRGFLPGRGPQ